MREFPRPIFRDYFVAVKPPKSSSALAPQRILRISNLSDKRPISIKAKHWYQPAISTILSESQAATIENSMARAMISSHGLVNSSDSNAVTCPWLILSPLILSERKRRLEMPMKKISVAVVTMLFFLCGSLRAADKIRIGVPQQVVHWMVFPLAQKKGFSCRSGRNDSIPDRMAESQSRNGYRQL
jgi:hypothetical protein